MFKTTRTMQNKTVFESCFIAKNVNVLLCAKHVLHVLSVLTKQQSNFIEFQYNKKYHTTLWELTALFSISGWFYCSFY